LARGLSTEIDGFKERGETGIVSQSEGRIGSQPKSLVVFLSDGKPKRTISERTPSPLSDIEACAVTGREKRIR